MRLPAAETAPVPFGCAADTYSLHDMMTTYASPVDFVQAIQFFVNDMLSLATFFVKEPLDLPACRSALLGVLCGALLPSCDDSCSVLQLSPSLVDTMQRDCASITGEFIRGLSSDRRDVWMAAIRNVIESQNVDTGA